MFVLILALKDDRTKILKVLIPNTSYFKLSYLANVLMPLSLFHILSLYNQNHVCIFWGYYVILQYNMVVPGQKPVRLTELCSLSPS